MIGFPARYREDPRQRLAQPGRSPFLNKENWTLTHEECSIKKPKTMRYPSLKGTDPKFRRNHRHALHGTMKALVRQSPEIYEGSLGRRGARILTIHYRRRRPRASARPHKFCFDFPAQGHEGTACIDGEFRNFSDMILGEL